MSIVCVVPTVRPQLFEAFRSGWQRLFDRHGVKLVAVFDGEPEEQRIVCDGEDVGRVSDVLHPDDRELVFHKTDSCRNAGFLWAAEHLAPTTFLSLDDDVLPIEGTDPVADLIEPLRKPCSISWMNTLSGSDQPLVRGFPYGVRNEAAVQVSHAGWVGSLDLDGPTQLMLSADPPTTANFFKGPLPRGVLAPFCGMAVAFTEQVAPHVYYAPQGPRTPFNRFGDIWLGVNLKRVCDANDWAIYYGNAVVNHTRASDVFKNLSQEAEGLRVNETWWKEGDGVHPYFAEYEGLRARYGERMCDLLNPSGQV
jgi:hypothetical protein